jgi:hypothetical protein
MATSRVTTVAQYLRELPAERRRTIAAVRRVISRNLPAGYRETMNWGMISYEVPLSRHPDTYNGRPLCHAALAAQKNYCAVYLMSVYQNPERLAALKDAFKKAGKKLDIGKSCVRFRMLDDLPLDAIGEAVAGVPVDRFIEFVEKSRRNRKR